MQITKKSGHVNHQPCQLLAACSQTTKQSKIPEMMVSNTPLSVRLKLRLVAAVQVGQMRHPPVLPVTSATAAAAATTPSAAESRASSVPATTLLHATTPPGRRAMVRVRHHLHAARCTKSMFMEQSVERSVDRSVRRSLGATTRPTQSSYDVVTRTAVSRASVRTQEKGHALFLTLLPHVYGWVAGSGERTRRAVHGPGRTAARRKPTPVVGTGRCTRRSTRPTHSASGATRTMLPRPTSSPPQTPATLAFAVAVQPSAVVSESVGGACP